MLRAFIGVVVLSLAAPAQAAKFKPGKLTDGELIAALASAQPADRPGVLDEIASRELVAACPALAERTSQDDNAAVRGQALTLMVTLDCPGVLDAAVAAVTADRIPGNRLAALTVVGEQGDPSHLALLTTVLEQDTSVQVRHKALTLAIDRDWGDNLPLLRQALRDDYNLVVRDAAVVLLAAEDAASHQALFEETPTLSPADRATILAVWETHPLPPDTGFLLATLADSHPPVAVSAAAALARLGDPSVVPVLREKLEREKDRDTRKALAAAIQTLEP